MFAHAKPEQEQAPKSIVQKKEAEKPVVSPNLTGIPGAMKSRFENLSGFSFDDVRVHYNSDKPAQLQALAYTQGNQVYVAPGQEKHLSHELGHVVQQKQGRVKPVFSMHGMQVNDDKLLEIEADTFSTRCQNNHVTQKKTATHVIQRKVKLRETEEDEEADATQGGLVTLAGNLIQIKDELLAPLDTFITAKDYSYIKNDEKHKYKFVTDFMRDYLASLDIPDVGTGDEVLNTLMSKYSIRFEIGMFFIGTTKKMTIGTDGGNKHLNVKVPTDEAFIIANKSSDDCNGCMTHNHPNGLALNNKDIANAISFNFKEVRAVGPFGVFSCKCKKNNWDDFISKENRTHTTLGTFNVLAKLNEATVSIPDAQKDDSLEVKFERTCLTLKALGKAYPAIFEITHNGHPINDITQDISGTKHEIKGMNISEVFENPKW